MSTVLPDQGSGTVDVSGVNPWTSASRDFLLVVLLLTPLQAAGEEFVFRGYLAQACGGLTARFSSAVSGTVAVVVPAVLFALAHGLGQDAPIFFDRLAFGVVAGVLVLLTGGLEAGIAMHVLNNFLAFGLAIVFGDMTETLVPTDGTWWSIPVTLVQSLSYLALTLWAARRMGVQSRTTAAILESRRPPRVMFPVDRSPPGRRSTTVVYGVIGSTRDSDSLSLGSSPSRPARASREAGQQPGFRPLHRPFVPP